jgi:hypothetical protein
MIGRGQRLRPVRRRGGHTGDLAGEKVPAVMRVMSLHRWISSVDNGEHLVRLGDVRAVMALLDVDIQREARIGALTSSHQTDDAIDEYNAT